MGRCGAHRDRGRVRSQTGLTNPAAGSLRRAARGSRRPGRRHPRALVRGMPPEPGRTHARSGLRTMLVRGRAIRSSTLRTLRRSPSILARHQPRRGVVRALPAPAVGVVAIRRHRRVRGLAAGDRSRAEIRWTPVARRAARAPDAPPLRRRARRCRSPRARTAPSAPSAPARVQSGGRDRCRDRPAGTTAVAADSCNPFTNGPARRTASRERAGSVPTCARDGREGPSSRAGGRCVYDGGDARILCAGAERGRCGGRPRDYRGTSRVETASMMSRATSSFDRSPSRRSQSAARA